MKPTYYTSVDQLESFMEKIIPQKNNDGGLFTTRSAKSWLKSANKRPVPKMLFGKFWFEGELCILFADSNVGKSILAVQIANAISKGESKHPFEMECEAQQVIYFDFELSEKQFEARYSVDFEEHYDFHENLSRSEMNPEVDAPPGFKSFDEYLHAALERELVQTGCQVIIIDNITYLRAETEQAKDALPLMKHLKALKKKYNLSILALAHTPKRDPRKEITRNDLQGSKMLMNFCDSSFTIGESAVKKNLRYVKQVKQRNTDQVYGGSNVCVCEVNKPHNFLQYEFRGFGKESDHLTQTRHGEGYDRSDEALQLQQEGLTLREIGERMGITHSKVDRILKSAQQKSQA